MENLPTLKTIIDQNAPRLARKSVTLGFDGFVDTVVRIIRQKNNKENLYFDTMGEFGRYTSDKSGKNFSVELEELVTKLGGNMPIMANALANLGANVSCLGTLGYPTLHPVFNGMSEKASLNSFAEPGYSTALEFNDGKILLAQMTNLNKVDWTTIREAFDINSLIGLFQNRDLIGILNWSELDHSTSMWKGLLDDVLTKIPVSYKKPIGFFDLSDCSKRSNGSILEALELLKSFSVHWQVVLSLNLNEAGVVYEALNGSSLDSGHIEQGGEKLFHQIGIDMIVIHYSKQALAWNRNGMHKMETRLIQNPILSTGAGDNFNAGFCAGMLMEADLHSSLELGHAVAGHYMKVGISPTMSDLVT